MGLWRFKNIVGLISAVIFSIALSACHTAPAPAIEPKSDVHVDLSGKVHSLQRQIQERDKMIEERDKRIDELESQLDALKLIDEDREKQRKPLRPPSTLDPVQ
jgi:hypothetical protein